MTGLILAVAVLRDLKSYGPMLEDVCRRFRYLFLPARPSPWRPGEGMPHLRCTLKLGREEILSICNSFTLHRLARGFPKCRGGPVNARFMDETMGRGRGA
jgi:hypothetical protein